MKLVTYTKGSHPNETVLYTASGVRLNQNAPTVVEDDDVPELKGHSFDVADAPTDASVGDVIREGDVNPSLTVSQLKEQLAAKDLPTTGNKKELAERLRESETAS